jgi:hypothetical protein
MATTWGAYAWGDNSWAWNVGSWGDQIKIRLMLTGLVHLLI